MPAGEAELNTVFFRTFQLLGKLSTIYSCLSNGLSVGTVATMSELETSAKQFFEDGTLASFIKDPSKVDIFYGLVKGQMENATERIQATTRRVLDGMAIVYAHGIIDAGVYGYLEVLSLATPEAFKKYIENKQVTLTDIESKPYEQLYKEKLNEYMEKVVERNSLISKLRMVHDIVNPTDTHMNRTTIYDEERIGRFDEARHKIVHGNDWSNYSINFTTESFYWDMLNFYLCHLVCYKTGLRLSDEEVLKAVTSFPD